MSYMKKKTEIAVFAVVIVVATVISVLALKQYYSKDIDKKTDVKAYDTTPISEAYKTGETSSLKQYDKAIYDKAVEVLDMIITDGMTDYEKELAVHDYLTNNVSYDQQYLNVFYGHDADSETPYGALVKNKAICTGYSTSFQMFMDMLDIPCKTVFGKTNNNSDHGWNMVKLEGDWYYVDVTWDDPIPETETSAMHKYLNATQKLLEDNRHIWDTTGLPKADSTKYWYKTMTETSENEVK